LRALLARWSRVALDNGSTYALGRSRLRAVELRQLLPVRGLELFRPLEKIVLRDWRRSPGLVRVSSCEALPQNLHRDVEEPKLDADAEFAAPVAERVALRPSP